MPPDSLRRIEIIEQCCEFLLVSAARGVPGDEGSQAGAQLQAFFMHEWKRWRGSRGVGIAASFQSQLGSLTAQAVKHARDPNFICTLPGHHRAGV
jgi:hypothetical protein